MRQAHPGPNTTVSPTPSPFTPELRELIESLPVLGEGRMLDPRDLGGLCGTRAESILKRLNRGGDLPPVTRLAGRPRWAPLDVARWLLERRAAA